jgi:hypothetical protein
MKSVLLHFTEVPDVLDGLSLKRKREEKTIPSLQEHTVFAYKNALPRPAQPNPHLTLL